jgi:thiol-disulfide isomerase/thioredoxin
VGAMTPARSVLAPAAALLAAAFGGCRRPAPAAPGPPPPPAPSSAAPAARAPVPAPAWTLTRVDGGVLRSDQFRGKVLVVDFWATWCRPCLAEMPTFSALEKKYGPAGLAIVGVSVDNGAATVRKYLRRHPVDYPIVMVNDKVIDAFGGMDGIPTTFIVDRNGMIRDRLAGLQKPAVLERRILVYLEVEASERQKGPAITP